jgi:nicotinate phosphoribosyltransferase
MGSRRTHERAAIATARAAYIGGFAATSNLAAGYHWGIPTAGTAAHAFTLLHDDERTAFRAQIDALGVGTTLLVDTYEVEAGIRAAVEVAGTSLGAIRLDSGDLPTQARDARALLDSLGATQTRIVVTSDLDEHAIAALASAPVDAYGIGTSVATGSGVPTAGFVYKLVARQDSDGDWVSVEKRSAGKDSTGGRKHAARRIHDGHATAEVLTVGGSSAASGEERHLQIPMVRGGEVVHPINLDDARKRCRQSLAELPAEAMKLSAGDPAIETLFEEPPPGTITS